MKISELVSRLENLKKLEGDIEVAVQYRDAQGDWLGLDMQVRFTCEPATCLEAESTNWTLKEGEKVIRL